MLVASEAIALYKQLTELGQQLDAKKDELRAIANGNKLELKVEGQGVVFVSTPRESSEKVVLVFNEKKLNEFPELRAKLLSSGIATEQIQKQSAAAASVTIRPNV